MQTLKDEDTRRDYDYMLDHPGMLCISNSVNTLKITQNVQA